MGRGGAVTFNIAITIAIAAVGLLLGVLYEAPLRPLMSSAAPVIPRFNAESPARPLPESLLPKCAVNTCNGN